MKNRYLIRAAKYFVYLVVLFIILYALLFAVGYSSLDSLVRVFQTNRVWLFVGVFIALPLAYPYFGFVTRTVHLTRQLDRDMVIQVMQLNDFMLTEEKGYTMYFRAANSAKRLGLLFEDETTITFDENVLTISGARKTVVKTEYRLNTFK